MIVRGHVVPNFSAEELLFVPRFHNCLTLYPSICQGILAFQKRDSFGVNVVLGVAWNYLFRMTNRKNAEHMAS